MDKVAFKSVGVMSRNLHNRISSHHFHSGEQMIFSALGNGSVTHPFLICAVFNLINTIIKLFMLAIIIHENVVILRIISQLPVPSDLL